MASADGVHWISEEKKMFLFNCLLPPALCQDPKGCISNRLKWSGNEKLTIFFTGSLVHSAVTQTCAKGRQLKGMHLWQGQWQHPVCSNPAKSTECWLYTLVLQNVHLTSGFAHKTRNSTFLPLPQWTQGSFGEGTTLRGHWIHTHRELKVKEGSRACLRAVAHWRDFRKDKWDVVIPGNWERSVNLQEI